MAPLLIAIASPIELIADSLSGNAFTKYAGAVAKDVADNLLVNGFVNPLIYQGSVMNKTLSSYKNEKSDVINAELFGKLFLKPSGTPYFFRSANTSSDNGTYVKITRNTEVRLVEVLKNTDDQDIPRNGSRGAPPTLVRVKIVNPDFLVPTLVKASNRVLGSSNRGDLDNWVCDVSLDQCLFDPDSYYNTLILGLMTLASVTSLSGAVNTALSTGLATAINLSTAAGFPVNSQIAYDLFGSIFRQFMSPIQNPVVGAIEGSMGRGLPGVITSMNFTWLDASFPWDTRWNSRAPMGCKITIGFDPIHDIAPGLDYYGANRAPNYNVGATMNVLAGDPLSDLGNKSNFRFNNYGRETFPYRK
jgi:hypothetical protein